MDTKSRRAKARIKEISEIKGRRYAEFYYYVLQGAKLTYAYTILMVMLLLAALADSVEALLLGIILSVLMAAYLELTLQDKLTARRQNFLWICRRCCQNLRFL